MVWHPRTRWNSLLAGLRRWVGQWHGPCLTCRAEHKRRAWVEDLLTNAGWTAAPVDNPAQLVAVYQRIKNETAWKEFMYRLGQLREGTRSVLERGSLDQFGRSHEAEQRSVLYVIDHLLTYFPAREKEVEEMRLAKEEQEALANRPLYGNDIMDPTDLL